MVSKTATAIAHPNIALVKYWGKSDIPRNLPVGGSISATLSGLSTQTRVTFDSSLTHDEVLLNDEEAKEETRRRIVGQLDLIRQLGNDSRFARVTTHNDFPTAAGMASSASGFAALTLAAIAALDINLFPDELSILARKGSGSAPRSLYGGFVEMLPPTPIPDASFTEAQLDTASRQSYALPLFRADHWPLGCSIAITQARKKPVSSTEGMRATQESSPYFDAWKAGNAAAVADAKKAIENKDFEWLTAIAEASCLRMHAAAMAANPGILYWRGETIELIHHARRLRADGLPVFFTIDAGPNVKFFTPLEFQDELDAALNGHSEILDLVSVQVGGAPTVATTAD